MAIEEHPHGEQIPAASTGPALVIRGVVLGQAAFDALGVAPV